MKLNQHRWWCHRLKDMSSCRWVVKHRCTCLWPCCSPSCGLIHHVPGSWKNILLLQGVENKSQTGTWQTHWFGTNDPHFFFKSHYWKQSLLLLFCFSYLIKTRKKIGFLACVGLLPTTVCQLWSFPCSFTQRSQREGAKEWSRKIYK